MPLRPPRREHPHHTPQRCPTCEQWPDYALFLAAALNALSNQVEAHTRHVDRRIDQLKELTMATQDDVNAIAAQEAKAFGEIRALLDQQVQQIADLQAAVDAGNTLDLSALQATTQQLDDIVPDAPVA